MPGSVNWRRASRRPKQVDPDQPAPELSRFKAVENTNYALDLARQERMSIVGIQGADLVDGNRTLTLGLVWQMMRKSVVQTLASLSKGGRDVTDTDVVRWANETVKKAGKSSSMRTFADPSLKSAVFYLDLLEGIKPGYVDYSLVYPGKNDDESRANAKLAISIARKMGALIFVVPVRRIRHRIALTLAGGSDRAAVQADLHVRRVPDEVRASAVRSSDPSSAQQTMR